VGADILQKGTLMKRPLVLVAVDVLAVEDEARYQPVAASQFQLLLRETTPALFQVCEAVVDETVKPGGSCGGSVNDGFAPGGVKAVAARMCLA
jgi:hypothetical protein